MEGKKLVEPAEDSIEEEDEVYFLDQEYSGLYDDNKPIGPAALRHIDRQTVRSIYYYCYVRTYVVRIMYDT